MSVGLNTTKRTSRSLTESRTSLRIDKGDKMKGELTGYNGDLVVPCPLTASRVEWMNVGYLTYNKQPRTVKRGGKPNHKTFRPQDSMKG